jgi:transcriptional regulator with XRE-family HTH domain
MFRRVKKLEKIGDRIKQLRIKQGMTQKRLADIVGVREATLSRYENDKRIQNWEILIMLADVFDTSVDYLLGRTDYSYSLKKSVDNSNLQDEKLQLYQMYRHMNKEEKEILIERAITLYEIKRMREQNSEPERI